MLPIIVATTIFIVSLAVIFTEKMNRTIMSIAGAALMVLSGHAFNFYHEHEAVQAIDFETLGLLLGMMTLVALLEPTGFFQYLAVWAARLSKGKPLHLVFYLGIITSVLSMFLDNVTTVVLIAPVTILISEIIGLNPIPFLVAEAMLSNISGVATLVGDPPNIMIASAANLSFNDFLTHSFPIIIFVWIAAFAMLRYLFRGQLTGQSENVEAIMGLNPKEALDDPLTARKVLIVLGAALILLFFQEILMISSSVIALSAAAAALVWIQPDPSKVFKRIEWNVLIFFASLFVLVGGLEKSGMLRIMADSLTGFSFFSPVIFGLLILWGTAFLAAFVDNIPITIALIPIIQGLSGTGINITPLWWALAIGVGLGGNGTLIGASANIIVSTLSEKTRHPITTLVWNRYGMRVMLISLIVASILFIIAYPFLSR